MRRFRAPAIALVLLAGSAWPIAGVAGPACATDGPRAGLVIDTGARVLRYCVGLDAASVTGLHLLELAHAQHGLDYRAGLGGAAVCRLAGTGVNVDDCFAEYPDYWGYWTSDGDGSWSWSSQGAGDARVRDGDLQGWVWGQGDTGQTHDAPPSIRAADLCPNEPPPPSPTPSAHTPTVAPPTPEATREPEQSRNPVASRTPTAGVPTTTPSPAVAAAPADPGPPGPRGSGSPAGLLAGLVIALVLMAAGFLRLRARSGGAS